MANLSLANLKEDFKSTAAKIADGFSKPVTTISTICVKCGEFIRLTLSVLRISDEKVISIDEMHPSFVDVGSNLSETNQLTDLHNELRAKLETKQANIEELLTKADKLVTEQPENQAVVYEAMAESLGATWKDLNDQLNLRENLLKDAVHFYTSANKHQDQLNIMENFLKAIRSQDDNEFLRNATTKHKEIANGILETAVQTMTFGDKSIGKIREIGSKTDNLEKAKDVVRACMKIEAVMLTLNDKRKELENVWEEKRTGLEWSTQASEIYEDLQKIEEWVRRRADDLRNQNLGDSEHTVELLQRDHEIIMQECQEMVQVSNRLGPLNKQLNQAGCNDGGDLDKRCEKVKGQMDDLFCMLENRRQLLAMSLNFFRSANLALVHLNSMSNEVKSMTLGKEKQKILSQHGDLSNRIQNAAQPAQNQGCLLLDKTGRGSDASRGIEIKLHELEQKYEELLAICSALKEQAILKSQAILELASKFNGLNSWLTNVGEAALYSMRDMGTTQPTAADFLERHKLLASDIKTKSREFEIFFNEAANAESMPDQQNEDIKVQARNLKTRWEKFQHTVQSRLSLGEIYHNFHRDATKLSSNMNNVDELVKTSRVSDLRPLANFETLWNQNASDFQALKHQGDSFNIFSRKLIDDVYLNISSAQICVEEILEGLGSRQVSLGRSWTELQSKAKQDQEFKQFWDKFLVDCEKLIDQASELRQNFQLVFKNFEERPPSRVALRQQTTLSELKTNFQLFEQKIESLLRTAEATAVPADRRVQNERLVSSLLETLRSAQMLNAHYEVLTGMTITFFRNLQKIDDWIEKVAQKFGTENLSKLEAEGRSDQLYQEHRAAAQTLEEFIKFATNEAQQILNQAKQTDIPDSVKIECLKLPSLVQERILIWNEMFESQGAFLRQYDTISKFEREIIEILETIEILTKHVRDMKQNIGLSPQAYQAAYSDYKNIESKVDVTDQRVSTVLNTAENYLSGQYRGNTKLRDSADSLNKAWSRFRHELDDFKQKITAAENYWTLAEESEVWMRETTEYIVDTGRQTKQVTSSQQAEELQNQLDTFTQPKAAQQQERLQKIERFAHVLYGEEGEHKIERHKRRYKEIVDSLHVIGTQLQTLKETFISSEEAVLKEIQDLRVSPKGAPPKFVDALKDGQVTEGSRFEFICQVHGKPEPDVTWFKGGVAISNNPDYKTSFSNGVCTLKIEETMTEDTSVYTCKAFNSYGSDESAARLTVKESPFLHMKAPEFVRKLQNSTVTESESHIFDCVVQGHPPPVVSWYRNDQCVDRLTDYQTATDQSGLCKLKISRATQNDHAVFKCRAVNPAGESSTSAFLNVTVVHQPPKITQPLTSVTVQENGRAVFEARVIGDPPPDVTWYKNGGPISQDPNCQVITEEFFECHTNTQSADLPKIVNFQNNHVDTWTDRRVEENEYRNDQKYSAINGNAENDYVSPHFTKTIISVVTEEGSEVKFDGVVTGSPEPEISWTKNGQQLNARDYRQSFFNGHTNLTIPSVTLDHSGKYVCSAKNPAGLATSSAQLVVTVTKEAPDFIERLISQEVEEGGPLRWQVKVSGSPPPKVTWLKNDQPLVHSHEYQTVNLGSGTYALYVPRCNPADSGQYTCRAENDAGEARSTADLVVRRSGEPAKSYVHVTRVYTKEHGKDEASTRTRVGPTPFGQGQANFGQLAGR